MIPDGTGGARGDGTDRVPARGEIGNVELDEGVSAASDCNSAGTMSRTGPGGILLWLSLCFRRDRAGRTSRAERGRR